MAAAQSIVVPLRLIRTEGSHGAILCLTRMGHAELLAEQQLRPFLHPAECARLEGMASLRRQSYLIGRYCAKQALAHQMAMGDLQRILIEPGVFGQPLVRAPTTNVSRISISHSADYGCALAFDPAQPMGLDIELTPPKHDRALRAQLTPAETNRIENIWRHENACVWLWTAKEALGKTLFTGLTVPMWMYEVSTAQRANLFLMATFTHMLQYKALTFLWNDAVVTIVLPARTQLELSPDCGIAAMPFPALPAGNAAIC